MVVENSGEAGLGNTNCRPSNSYKWIMVLNNYTEDELKILGAEVPYFVKNI